jgi:hypothetical protein
MPVDANILSSGLPELKYNDLPDVSAISQRYAAADQARADTARTNILAKGDQLAYDNTVGAQNALAQNPDLRGQDLISATAPYGTQGAKLADSQIGADQANTNLTSDKLKTAQQLLPSIVDQRSLDQANDFSLKNFGSSNLPKIYNEQTKQQLQQMSLGIDKIMSHLEEQQKIGISQQTADTNEAHLIRSDQNQADFHTLLARNTGQRIYNSSPEGKASAIPLNDDIKSVSMYSKDLPNHNSAMQGIERVSSALDKEPDNGGPIIGGLAEERANLINSAGTIFGLSPEQLDSLKNTQDLNHVMKQMVGMAASSSAFKSSRGIPVAEANFVKDATAGNVTYTKPMLKQLLGTFKNIQQSRENDMILRAQNLVKQMGSKSGYDVMKVAKMQPKAILSIDGTTVTSPDGRSVQLPTSEQAKQFVDHYNSGQ